MNNKNILFFVTCLISTLGVAQVCLFPRTTAIPVNSTFAVGPIVYGFSSTNSQIFFVIYDAWDVTDAVNRIGNWNGIITSSDCPMNLKKSVEYVI